MKSLIYICLPIITMFFLSNSAYGQSEEKKIEKNDSILISKKEFQGPTVLFGPQQDSVVTTRSELKSAIVMDVDKQNQEKAKEQKIDLNQTAFDPEKKVKIVSDEKNVLKPTRK